MAAPGNDKAGARDGKKHVPDRDSPLRAIAGINLSERDLPPGDQAFWGELASW